MRGKNVITTHSSGSWSNMFVALVASRRMTQKLISRRVILKTSITSLLVILSLFLIVYTAIILYITGKRITITDVDSQQYNTWKRRFQSRNRHKNSNKLMHLYDASSDDVHNFLGQKTLWDPGKLYNVFSITPQCSNFSMLIIIIASSPQNFERRQAIRETWCNPLKWNRESNSWKCVFLVGRSTSSIDFNTDVEVEQYGDVLFGDYVDSYRNLTMKVFHGFHWAEQCSESRFILKTDDDCFVNTGILYQFLLSSKKNTKMSENLYVGKINFEPQDRVVIRNTDNRWSVSYSDFPEDLYPPYASGAGYLISRDLLRRVNKISKHITVISNEDAYVGIVINRLDVSPIQSSRFSASNMNWSLCNYRYLWVIHQVKPREHSAMLQKSSKAAQECPANTNPDRSWR